MNDECMVEMEPEWSSWHWNECTLIYVEQYLDDNYDTGRWTRDGLL